MIIKLETWNPEAWSTVGVIKFKTADCRKGYRGQRKAVCPSIPPSIHQSFICPSIHLTIPLVERLARPTSLQHRTLVVLNPDCTLKLSEEV